MGDGQVIEAEPSPDDMLIVMAVVDPPGTLHVAVEVVPPDELEL